tara:strand:+ start:13891 stop:14052 length:162 start_codon:yes stop_codon:yes gene_type:complete
MKWWKIIKEGGAVTFGGHGANPLLSSKPPAITDDEKEVDKNNIYQEDEEIAKD